MKITGQCLTCGGSFSGELGRKFCSQACFHRSLAGVPVNPDRVAAMAAKLRRGASFPCEVCGKEFWRKPSAIKKGDARFCSKSCYFAGQKGVTKPMPLGRAGSMLGRKHKPETIEKLRAASTRVQQERGIKNPTVLERILYAALAEAGVEFTPQRGVGPFVVDAYIERERIAIEVDGAFWHSRPKIQEKDRREAEFMSAAGVRLVRITEAQAKADIRRALRDAGICQ